MVIMDVDTMAAYLGRPPSQADWLGPEVGCRPALFCIYQMN